MGIELTDVEVLSCLSVFKQMESLIKLIGEKELNKLRNKIETGFDLLINAETIGDTFKKLKAFEKEYNKEKNKKIKNISSYFVPELYNMEENDFKNLISAVLDIERVVK